MHGPRPNGSVPAVGKPACACRSPTSVLQADSPPSGSQAYRSSPLGGCCQVVVRVFFEVGFDGEGVAALVPGRIVVPGSGSGLSEEPAFGV